ncbi:Sterile alpha motif [Desmophyllum pertusum]|uniref:Sterile alpha motif n=1 Tax=Desmophyllum pertusum TaxID=174260 RepID=A0A9W9YR13_9CNID|nr:Sterile alpha motif [Desmophyllum pertusum]
MSSSVEDWLRSLGFIHYTQAFLDNGYDELEICKEIGKEDLDAIGVRNFKDRTDILNAVDRLKQAGTAVYFVLEAEGNSEPLQAQPERDTYPPVSLKLMLYDKLEEDKIDLSCAPYSHPDGSEGSLETLVTIYADKFYTYEEDVLTALRTLRLRQAEKEGTFDDSTSQILPAPSVPGRAGSTRHSSKYKSCSSEDRDEEGRETVSDEEFQHKSVSSEDQTSPTGTGINPADYLDVDSPAQRGKKSKKRRKVERNTNLSRSLDSLKELHVNVAEPKPRDREPSSMKSRPFKFKWLYGSKKKNQSYEIKKQPLEKKLSNPSNKQDYDMLASAIKMGEEDRMALMIMVKQGELTVEEAVEQLKRYEEDCSLKGEYLKPKGDFSNDDEKIGNKPKLKRGIFGKSTKRKSSSRPSSEFIACEMTTMSEDDRINLMRGVKSGDMSVDQALKRFISYEEKHKKSDSDDVPVRESPRLPKSAGFSRISIKRVSGVISSSFKLPSNVTNEPNAVFYTGEDGASADGSVSSGDEVLVTNDSSPVPSPKRLLANIQGLNKSQHSSSSSVDSMERVDEKPAPSNPALLHRQPNFLSEMKVVLGKQAQSVDNKGGQGVEDALHPGLKSVSACNKHVKPRPTLPDRKTSLPLMEAQKQIVLPPNPTGSLKRVPPDVPSRHGSAVVAPHRAPPPVPSRPSPKSTDDQRKPNVVGKTDQRTRTKAVTDEIESNDLEVEAKKPDSAKFKVDPGQTTESEIQVFFDPAKLEQSTVEVKDTVVQRPRHKPPPLPPRPTSSSFHEEPENTEARSVETQTSPRSPNSTQLNNKDSKIAASTEKLSEKPPIPEASDKPQLKPKPKPKPRPRPRMAAGPDKKDEVYSAVPQPRL